MKILLCVPEFPPNHVGGGGVVYENLAKNYVELGHQVTVLAGDHAAKKFFAKLKYVKKSSYNLVNVPQTPYPKGANFVTAMPPSFPAILQVFNLIRKEQFDVAHVHGFGHIFIDICCIYFKILSVPYVFTLHGFPQTQHNSFIISKIYAAYKNILANFSLRQAKKVTSVSLYTANNVQNLQSKNTLVIPNGLDEFFIKNATAKKYKIRNKTITVFSVGRLVKMKGFQNFIKLLKNKDINYLIAGRDAGYKKNLQKLAKKLHVAHKVKYLGFISKTKVLQNLKSCDAVAITSLSEPFNIFALEARSLGKVIITSNKGGLKESLKDYERLVSLESKDLIGNVKRAAQKTTKFDTKKYSWKNISNDYLKVLESCIQKT
jgi:glycosyltransferase involved in cell wall biosynthesis